MKIEWLNKSFGDIKIFENFSLEIEERSTLCVMGPSGVGKSTLLNIVTGLTDYTGKVEMNGEVSAVFSEPALLKNLNVYDNLRYAVAHAFPDKKVMQSEIENVLRSVELWDRRKAFPDELSSGMAQRVALARGFLLPSDYLIMDEAFKGLDTALKIKLRGYFLKLNAEKQKTVIIITHELDDALFLADRLILLRNRPCEVVLDKKIYSDKRFRTHSSPELKRLSDEYMQMALN